ncbi:MAG: hypothetical protein OEQ24_03425 [Gammaproteobacteria bacterium]|nr:hypothetical protein [Gammaproteobacteria bacterium]
MFLVRSTKKYLATLLLVFSPLVFAGENIITDKESFAQEYAQLGLLLEKVQDKQTARLYKPQIIKELSRIKSSVGEQSDFENLSPIEKKIFVKKFQNNNLHCGYVTKVVDERNRLLLNKEAKSELGDLLDQLLQ